MDEFKKDIVRIVSGKADVSDSMLEVPPDPKMGDFALPCFTFAKEMKKSPAEIAKEIAENSKATEMIEKITAAGPYVNFFLNKQKFAEKVLTEITKLKKDYGKSLAGKNLKVIVEFSSPNTNKPQHLGHVRNNLLGASISRILEFASQKVYRVNAINDRGIHIAKSMVAYKKYGEGKEPDKKSDHFVGEFYVLFEKKAKEDSSLLEEAYEMLRKWEEGDKETLALWKKMNNWVYKGFEKTYSSLGIDFDKTYYESEVYKKGKKLVIELFEKGVFNKNQEGSIYADLEEFDLPEKVVLRADGTSVYSTYDLALAQKKFEDFEMDSSVYVVASEQDLYFRQMFAIFKKIGFSFADRLFHRSYGMVNLPEGKMKSREGTVVDADDIIQEMTSMARAEVEKRYSDLTDVEIEKRAHAIGLAGLKFYMLKQDPVKDIEFNPKESISFEGETGPYVQYAFARISSILRKYGKPIKEDVNFGVINSEEEKQLIKTLSSFPDVSESASKNYDPSRIAHYLITLVQAFNDFYHNCPVLTENEEVKKTRLLISYCTRHTIGNGLMLLGIETLEEM